MNAVALARKYRWTKNKKKEYFLGEKA